MSRKFWISNASLISLIVMLIPIMGNAQPAKFVAGTHYSVLERPVRTRDSSKIEVVEVFWYGCSHCYDFDPLVGQWKKTQADDVDFWTSPAIWNKRMETHAKAFFTAKVLGVQKKLHAPLFTALIVERKALVDPAEIANLFADYGVDREEFKKTFSSFSVNSQVKQANARARSYGITGTPEMVVNGKYRISARMAGNQAKMLEVVDFLVNKERAMQAAK